MASLAVLNIYRAIHFLAPVSDFAAKVDWHDFVSRPALSTALIRNARIAELQRTSKVFNRHAISICSVKSSKIETGFACCAYSEAGAGQAVIKTAGKRLAGVVDKVGPVVAFLTNCR